MRMNNREKSSILLVSLILMLCVTVGGTLAFLIAKTGTVSNIFTPSKVTTAVTETRSGDTKSDVKIQNTGDTEAWIRATVVVTWQDVTGKVYGKTPVSSEDCTVENCQHNSDICEADYIISYNLTDGWLKGDDGFYYWTKPVAALQQTDVSEDTYTGVLINSCQYLKGAPDGYSLNVEIIGSGIQSTPNEAVLQSWSSGVSGVNSTGNSRTLAVITQ